MHYSNSSSHLINLCLLTSLISLIFISCNVTDAERPAVVISEFLGTWNPVDVEGNVSYFESFLLKQDFGVHEVKDESNRTILYRHFTWEIKIPGKVIEITLLRRIQHGVEHSVHGFKEVIDVSILEKQLIMYDKRWNKKES